MKYWRGYLIAAIIAACTWGLQEFAATHSALVDMIYPYMTRTVMEYLAQWSSSVDFCIWQSVLAVLIVVGLAAVVLMFVLKWNPVQLFGWVLVVVSLFNFATTAVFGLNNYAGPLAEDIRLENTEYAYSVSELEKAAAYYREYANAMSNQITRDENGNLQYSDFETLSVQAADGYDVLVYDRFYPVFAGCTLPVKKLELDGPVNEVGKTVALTGESAVDPRIPNLVQPFAMCHEMAHRMAIASNRDADFAAFMACDANPSLEFRYSGYFMAYRACYRALESICESTGDRTPLQQLEAGESQNLKQDIRTYERYFGDTDCVDGAFCDILVLWHIETVILPLQEEEEKTFDPTDENQVDLSGIVNAIP